MTWIRTHDWDADPHARGAYSYARVGGSQAAKTLARPVEGTLFFAGEATDTEGRTGTVEGALATGLRAARQVETALKKTWSRRTPPFFRAFPDGKDPCRRETTTGRARG